MEQWAVTAGGSFVCPPGKRSAQRACERRREGYPPGGARPRSGLDRVARSRSDAPNSSLACRTALTPYRCCSESDFSQTLTGLRLIGSLQPDPSKGVAIKAVCLDRLTMSPGPKSVQEFLALRNLDLHPFAEPETFLKALAVAFNDLLESDSSIDEVLQIAEQAFKPGRATAAWQESVRMALSNVSSAAAHTVARLTWSAYSCQPDLARFLLEAVVAAPSMDETMSKYVDVTAVSAVEGVSDHLISLDFVLTEAELLVRGFQGDLHAALNQACKRDRRKFGNHAIAHILAQMKPAEVIAAALEIDDKQVLATAADVSIVNLGMLEGYSLRLPRLQVLWGEALKRDSAAWKIRKDVDELREEAFDCLVDGELDPALLRRVVYSPLVNVLAYSKRPKVWPLLPQDCREAVECSTAEAWIRALPGKAADSGFMRPEEELAVVLASPKMQEGMITALRALSFSQVLDVLAGNGFLRESLLKEIFSTFYDSSDPPSEDEMRRLGRLVASRGWRNFSRHAMSRYGVQRGLREFFEICAEHLEIWDRWRQGISEPTRAQLYDLLLETVCELYPSGPMESEIWSRSGGNPAKLDTSGSGQRQWEEAVRKSRYGSRLRAEELILEMREDYPLNERLAYLEKQWK